MNYGQVYDVHNLGLSPAVYQIWSVPSCLFYLTFFQMWMDRSETNLNGEYITAQVEVHLAGDRPANPTCTGLGLSLLLMTNAKYCTGG